MILLYKVLFGNSEFQHNYGYFIRIKYGSSIKIERNMDGNYNA